MHPTDAHLIIEARNALPILIEIAEAAQELLDWWQPSEEAWEGLRAALDKLKEDK